MSTPSMSLSDSPMSNQMRHVGCFRLTCYGLNQIDFISQCTYNVNMIELDWNDDKAVSNIEKHGVSFVEAKSVFYDEFAIQFFDEEHSEQEDRLHYAWYE